MPFMIKVRYVVAKACREAARTSTCWTCLRLALCFVRVTGRTRGLASLLAVLSPPTTAIETRRRSAELCAPSA